MRNRGLRARLEGVGIFFFSVFLRLFGQTGASLFLPPVVLAYTIFGRKIKKDVAPYLEHRFPGQRGFSSFGHRFRLLLSFAMVLLDSYWLGRFPNASQNYDWQNIEPLLAACRAGKGVVLLTAHLGNWQTALNCLDSLPVKMHILAQSDQMDIDKYFGAKRESCPFEIINSSDPFGGLVNATAALMRGEVVTIMGDRYLGGSYSTIDFLGDKVRMPTAAYMLAASVGAPVFIFFTARTARNTFEVKVWESFSPQYKDKEERQAMLDRYARKFSLTLEKYLKNFPYQWYNFFNFWKQ
jgi:predicted LPLAT superfamily acyltransferase